MAISLLAGWIVSQEAVRQDQSPLPMPYDQAEDVQYFSPGTEWVLTRHVPHATTETDSHEQPE
ncbi:MAG: hypothetical protein DWQ37_17700 [Planctomycetota bacterium]|nr:MAG: hypothetical protein DWQ37_17700 [Planctomycetota bacterium]